MTTATITTKGQITIPVAIRKELHVGPGSRVEFIKISDGHFELKAVSEDIQTLKGLIKTEKSVSVEEMNAAIKNKTNSL